jgi:WD40 repeat protein
LQFILQGPVDIRCVAFSPDGRHFAAASYDQTVKLWDLETRKVRFVFRGHSTPVFCVTFSPDGGLVASGDSEGAIQVWRASDGKSILTLRGHAAPLGGVVFSPDGLRLASASLDKTVKVWDMTSQPEARMLGNNSGFVYSMSFTPDGHWLAVPGGRRGPPNNEGTKDVRLWDPEGARATVVLGRHQDMVTCVAMCSEGRQLASGSLDRTVKLWDLPSGKLSRILGPHARPIHSLAFTNDGRRLAAATDAGTVTIWDPSLGKEVHQLKGHNGPINCLAFHPDGRELASAGQDGTVIIWDTDSGKEITAFHRNDLGADHLKPIFCVTFSPDGKTLAYGKTLAWGGAEHQINLWHRNICGTDIQFSRGPVLKGHTAPVTSIAYTPDGKRLASTSRDTTVKLWDPSSGQEILSLRAHVDHPDAVVFSSDGRRLASASNDIRIWETEEIGSRAPNSAAASLTDHPERVRAWHRNQAQACEQEKQWFGVNYHLDRLFELEPNSPDVHGRRGNAAAAQGQWDRASTEYARALDLGADGRRFGYPMALACLMSGSSEYGHICARLLEQLDNPKSVDDANNLAWIFALGPVPSADLVRPIQWSEKTVANNPRAYQNFNTLGALLYRAGRYEDSIRRLKEAIGVQGQGGTVHDWLFLAMAYHRLGKPDDARKWLDHAVEWIDKHKAAEVEDSTSPPWTLQVELALLHKEAEMLQKKNP